MKSEKTVQEQKGKFNKEIENRKRTTQNFGAENTMTKWKNSIENTKQRISELEDRSFEMI